MKYPLFCVALFCCCCFLYFGYSALSKKIFVVAAGHWDICLNGAQGSYMELLYRQYMMN